MEQGIVVFCAHNIRIFCSFKTDTYFIALLLPTVLAM